MCWNKEISMATFILAIIGVVYLWKRDGANDRWIAIFAGTIALIQLAEFFMWSDLSCGKMNKYASIFALIVLAFEPLMNMIGGAYFSHTPNKRILKYMLVAYLLFIIFAYITQIHNKQLNFCATSICNKPNNLNGFLNDKMCNLKWFFMDNINNKIGIIWIMFLMIPFLTMTPKLQGIILFTLGFVTFGMAALTNNAAQGSLWCWFSIGLIFYKILAG